MTTVYIGGEWNHRQSNVCGYSLLILRKITEDELVFDVIYGVNTDPEYVELTTLGGEVFSVVKGLRLLYELSFDSYVTNDILIYYTCDKVGAYATNSYSPKKPILKYYQQLVNYYRTLLTLDFYYISEPGYNFLSNLAKEYAKSGIYMFNVYGNRDNLVRDIKIPKDSMTYIEGNEFK